jgi:hypothetical protein
MRPMGEILDISEGYSKEKERQTKLTGMLGREERLSGTVVETQLRAWMSSEGNPNPPTGSSPSSPRSISKLTFSHNRTTHRSELIKQPP